MRMMKRNIYNVAMALTVLVCACARNAEPETANGGQLSFSPALSSPSSKVIFDGGAFPTDAGAFSVSAVALTGSTGTGQVLYFFNKAVAYDEAKTQWAFKADASGVVPRYYWPLAGGMNFYAFYPESDVLTTRGIIVPETDPETGQPETVPVISEGGLAYKNYTIKHTGGDYAPIEDDSEKTDSNLGNAYIDFMSATQLYDDVNTRTSQSVPLLFTHNLTRVNFQAVAARDLSIKNQVASSDGTRTYDVVNHVDISVDRIELLDIYSIGSYYSIAPHWRDLKAKYNYFPLTREMGSGTKLEYEEGEIGARTPVAVDIKKDGDLPAEMLVIPQSLGSASIKVWFTVRQRTVRNEGKTGEFVVNDYSETYIKNVSLSTVVSDFRISSCVTFLLNIDLDEITVSVTYSDWKSDGEITPVI